MKFDVFFVLKKRLSCFQTFFCIFKTVFVLFAYALYAFYEVVCLRFMFFMRIITSKIKKVVYLTFYVFCGHKNIYEESRFLCFLCLWDLFLKAVKLPQYHHLLYYYIIIIHCNHHNPFLLLQYSSFTTIYSYYHNLFKVMNTDIHHHNNTDYDKDY